MTVEQLYQRLSMLIASGHGQTTIYFDEPLEPFEVQGMVVNEEHPWVTLVGKDIVI